jgi:geranylgeranyl diphosphate synthase type II
MNLDIYKKQFEEYLLNQIPEKQPKKLYEPIHYILKNEGKRIRALFVLLSAESFGGKLKKALPGASAIEIFHNFTLLHDDIMDKAELRRGKETVHKKWDENTAILSGDTMLILAYRMLEQYEGETYKELNVLLNKTAIEVCEGQQMDMDFEKMPEIPVEKYLEMIRLKTAVLLGTALKYGGIISGASNKDLDNIYAYGENLGIAFQIQDDYLDSFGDAESFGKKIGGDIIDRKKTILYIESLNEANDKDRTKLLHLFNNSSLSDNIIEDVLEIYRKNKAPEKAKKWMELYTKKAIRAIMNTDMPDSYKNFWIQFANDLMYRNH